MENSRLKETKTSRALKKSLKNLLAKRNFNKITVNDLCQDAEVSRTSFYQNFIDKYDLLSSIIDDLNAQMPIMESKQENEYIEYIVDFTLDNKELIKNIINSNNQELTIMHINSIKNELRKYRPESDDPITEELKLNFFASGLVYTLYSLIKKDSDILRQELYTFFIGVEKALNDHRV